MVHETLEPTNMQKRTYIAAYHRSKFGKLLGLTVPEILHRSALETFAQVKAGQATLDAAPDPFQGGRP